MIVKPSIAFNDFAGSANGVTARNVKGRLLKNYPSADIKAMGFPPTWEAEPLWNTK